MVTSYTPPAGFGIIERDFTAGSPTVSETINNFIVLPAGAVPVVLALEVLIAGDSGTDSVVALGPPAYDSSQVQVVSNGATYPVGAEAVSPGLPQGTVPPGGVFAYPLAFVAGATPGVTAVSARGKVFYLVGSGV